MKYLFVLATLLIFATQLCQATVTIDTVTVGDAGNTGELSGLGAGGYGPNRVCGVINYVYDIGKCEVTTAQYTEFLNAKAKTDNYSLYSSNMAINNSHQAGCNIQRSGSTGSYLYSVGSGSIQDVTDWGNKPVNYVSYWDSLRFANWLGNGQGDGDTESGAYKLTTSGIANNTIVRNAGWTWAVTSEDEWYKAAYYKGGGATADYWDYPIQSQSISTSMANYHGSNHTTGVGFYAYTSSYGTFDQGGNVWEWNDAIIIGTHRGIRGGSFNNYENLLHASYRYYFGAVNESDDVGFRVSKSVPEPSSMIVLAGGLATFGVIRRRKH